VEIAADPEAKLNIEGKQQSNSFQYGDDYMAWTLRVMEEVSLDRSDHFSFAREGVPSLYTSPGEDHIEKGKEWDTGSAWRPPFPIGRKGLNSSPKEIQIWNRPGKRPG